MIQSTQSHHPKRSLILGLYLTTIAIWGSTWFAIKFQLGKVDPAFSVAYRFALAAVMLFAFCLATKRRLKFKWKDHLFLFLQGVFSFSIGYWFVYLAEVRLTSGLVAVITSSLIFMNMFNGWLFVGSKINRSVVLGAMIGITGILLVFWPELSSFRHSHRDTIAVILAFSSTLIYSFGNIIVVRNRERRLPVMPTNAYSMAYGAAIMFVLAFASGKPVAFGFSVSYVGSLLYLAAFGSVIAFYCFFTLIGEIGADKAAYGPVVIPVVALAISSVFEGYRWSAYTLAGVALLILGNIFVMNKSAGSPKRNDLQRKPME
jgi:drug/metabolite transporter (DMT)-like permease